MKITSIKVAMEEFESGGPAVVCRATSESFAEIEFGCGLPWDDPKTPAEVANILRFFADAVEKMNEPRLQVINGGAA